MYYYWYEWTRAFFEAAAAKAGRATKRLTTVESMIAGALAGSATVIITNPIWVVNTRMTTRKRDAKASDEEAAVKPPPKAPTTIGTLLSMLRDEGPQALFSGVVPALVLVINPILQYTLFEQLKNSVERRRGTVTPTVAFVLGALGKLFATSITYPYITVKSRMHVGGNDKEGVMGAIRRVIKEEGYAGLYRGTFPRLLHLWRGGMRKVADVVICRNRPEGHSERPHGGFPLCVQGRVVCSDGKAAHERQEGPEGLKITMLRSSQEISYGWTMKQESSVVGYGLRGSEMGVGLKAGRFLNDTNDTGSTGKGRSERGTCQECRGAGSARGLFHEEVETILSSTITYSSTTPAIISLLPDNVPHPRSIPKKAGRLMQIPHNHPGITLGTIHHS